MKLQVRQPTAFLVQFQTTSFEFREPLLQFLGGFGLLEFELALFDLFAPLGFPFRIQLALQAFEFAPQLPDFGFPFRKQLGAFDQSDSVFRLGS